jgi:hypothetical protein
MNKAMIIRRNRGTVYTPNPHIHDHSISCGYVMKRLSISVAWIRVITKLPNSEQSYKGKVKTHNYINRQNQSTTGKLCKEDATNFHIKWFSIRFTLEVPEV